MAGVTCKAETLPKHVLCNKTIASPTKQTLDLVGQLIAVFRSRGEPELPLVVHVLSHELSTDMDPSWGDKLGGAHCKQWGLFG